MVRIKYWRQDTLFSGKWCVSGTMTLETAEKIIKSNVYENASIVMDEEGWPGIAEVLEDALHRIESDSNSYPKDIELIKRLKRLIERAR